MNNKRLAACLILLIVQSLLGPCGGQRYSRGHHHHHDSYGRGGRGGILGGIGTALGIVGAGLVAGAVTRGITRGFSGGGAVYPPPVAYPVAPVAYPATRYVGSGYDDPYYAGGIRTGYGGAYGGGTVYDGGYPLSRRVRTVSDSLYSNVY